MNTKLTDYTLQRAYTERDNFNKRPTWLNQLIDIISLFIPFLVTNTKHYRNKLINDGFSDLENFWKHGAEQIQDQENINKVIGGMNQFKDFMTEHQQKQFNRLKNYSNLSFLANERNQASTLSHDKSGDNGGRQVMDDLDDDFDSIKLDANLFEVELPYSTLLDKNHFKSIKVPLEDLLRWYNPNNSPEEYFTQYSNKNSLKKLNDFENIIIESNLGKKLIESLKLFADIMTPKEKHNSISPDMLEKKLATIKNASPALYEFFFNPLDDKKLFFINNPFIFKGIDRISQAGDNEVKTLIFAFTILNKLMPIEMSKDKDDQRIDYTNPNKNEIFSAFSSLIKGDETIERKLMLLFIFKTDTYNTCSELYLTNMLDEAEDMDPEIDWDKEINDLHLKFMFHIEQMRKSYLQIHSFIAPRLDHVSKMKSSHNVEIEDGDKENLFNRNVTFKSQKDPFAENNDGTHFKIHNR